jgi:signal transduction histidine kinase
MNIFGITSLMIFFAGIGFGFFIYSSDRKSPLNKIWFIVSIFTAVWGLSLFGVTSANTTNSAMKWQYILDISATFIPVTYFYFVCNLLKIKKCIFNKIFLFLGFLVTIFSLTPYQKVGMALKYGFYWINPGIYYPIFAGFFTLITIVSLILLINGYIKNKREPVFRAQIRNTLIAGIIGFGGGATNFFPQLINIYPFGNYFVLLYVFFMSYGVLKYKLLSKRVISAQLLAGAIVLVFLFNLLNSSNDFYDWIVKFILFALILFFSIFLVRGVFKEIEQKEKIEKLAMELERANVKLRELDQMKSEFLSLATHQIRAPLTAIKGYSSMLIEGDFGELPQTAKDSVQTIMKSCQNLIDVVGDFLNISRIEQGRMVYEKSVFNLKDLVKEVIIELKPNVERAGLSFDLNLPIENIKLNADRGKIKQCIGNIIDNAIKYTPHGSIHISMIEKEQKAKISVKDTGVGIDPSEIGKLFSKFSRAKDASKTNVSGTGLGLYIAKKMVEAHGGDIKVSSEGKGKGTTFTIELPVYRN